MWEILWEKVWEHPKFKNMSEEEQKRALDMFKLFRLTPGEATSLLGWFK